MRTIFLILTLLALNACNSKQACDQGTLDAESAKIGAYEITCEELEAL